jgi:hypothetical protein
MKPFRVSADWIEWAHGPGAEDGQEAAKLICDLPVKGGVVSVDDPRLVYEIVDVSELYTGSTRGLSHDPYEYRQRVRANRVSERGRSWLRENDYQQPAR